MRPLVEFRRGLRVGGHPLHTLLIHFPIAFWSLVFPLELAGWLGGWEMCWRLAYLANAAGIAAALPAAAAGFFDLVALADQPKPSAVANTHMLVMLGSLGIFGTELYLRHGAGAVPGAPVLVILGLSLFATLLLFWGGWLGGELVFRYGAGLKGKF